MINPHLNLPPGVRAGDIEEPEMVRCYTCNGEGYIETLYNHETGYTEGTHCPTCYGTGQVRKETNEQ